MPPSQLKRLKASLREQGIIGQQKSKKEKKNQKPNADQRAQKAVALAAIREASNPFDFKALARPKKFEYATNRPQDSKKVQVLGRPGVTKSLGEETRRKTLLPEMNRRNKVGGILDRRIGEDDPSMSLDERMMKRFEREQQRKRMGGGNVFDLEEAEDEVELTHGGQSLNFDGEDYDAASINGSDDDEDDFLRKKRKRDGGGDDGEEEDGAPAEDVPERKKSKKEVMEEIIAKSKQHKYERQAQKEDDDELREELDKDLPDVLAALRGHLTKKDAPPELPKEAPREELKEDFGINPERAAMLAGLKTREEADKEYDTRVRQMLFDQRAKPAERTKTEEEKAQENAKRLKELEQDRLRRMRGESESESEEENTKAPEEEDAYQESEHDDAAEFGLPTTTVQGSRPEGVEDEDDFELDDEIIASDSEADISDESEDEFREDDTMAVDEDDDFLRDVLPEKSKPEKAVNGVLTLGTTPSTKLAYTYPIPRTHEELLKVYEGLSESAIPIVTQRIRALYHSGLHHDNKNKLADFGCALVDHISYLSNNAPATPLAVTETLIRHIHSLARSYPIQIATRFRHHLQQLQASNDPTPGDLMILTAAASIFPASDKFNPIITPAMTTIARFLGLAKPSSVKDITTGAYLGALLSERYIPLSKRYIPELVRYTTLCLKSPHITPALISAHVKNIITLADLWSSTPAFVEIFTPLLSPLTSLSQTSTVHRLRVLIQNSRLHRRPQELHHHRPLPIKSSIPKFEEGFDPNKHYDPDRERAEATRLQKEYKREKKGALRELRKDANFIAREKLKEKKDRDRKYEEKYRKLVAEIQGTEGKEKNDYEREKRNRKRRG